MIQTLTVPGLATAPLDRVFGFDADRGRLVAEAEELDEDQKKARARAKAIIEQWMRKKILAREKAKVHRSRSRVRDIPVYTRGSERITP